MVCFVSIFAILVASTFAADPTATEHYKKGNTFMQQGELDQAINEFKKAISIDHNFDDAYYNLGYVYHMKAAKKNGTSIQDIGTRDPYAYYRGIVWKLGTEELNLAVKEFKEVLRLQPKAADAHLKLGMVYGNKGDFDSAISEYRETIRLDPKGPDGQDARHELALIYYYVKGKRKEAIEELEAVLKVNPNHSSAKENFKKIKEKAK